MVKVANPIDQCLQVSKILVSKQLRALDTKSKLPIPRNTDPTLTLIYSLSHSRPYKLLLTLEEVTSVYTISCILV